MTITTFEPRWLLGLLACAVAYRIALLIPSTAPAPADPLASLTGPAYVSATRLSADHLVLERADGTSHTLRGASFQIAAWDKDAAVYVTAGIDGQPGVMNVDDNGNGTVDDRLELGATGSDDAMLTPDHPDYTGATLGKQPSMILSRGAMQIITDDRVIPGPHEIRIDALTQDQRLTSRILTLESKRKANE